jgi:hypothetical protein
MCAAACASTTRAHAPHTRQFLIDVAAIRNACKCHKNNALAFSNHCSLRVLARFIQHSSGLPRIRNHSTSDCTRSPAHFYSIQMNQREKT